jgi:hypothetical protein
MHKKFSLQSLQRTFLKKVIKNESKWVFAFTVLFQFKLSNLEIKHIVFDNKESKRYTHSLFDKNAKQVKNLAIIRQ